MTNYLDYIDVLTDPGSSKVEKLNAVFDNIGDNYDGPFKPLVIPAAKVAGTVTGAQQTLLDESKSAVYATLAILYECFVGGLGWAFLSLINEEHEELDPFLRPPVTLLPSNDSFIGRRTFTSASQFDVVSGLDPATLTIGQFDVIVDQFVSIIATPSVVNWIE